MMQVAIVGVGGMGKTHIDNISTMQGVSITDVCDRSAQSKELAQQLGVVFHESIEALVAETSAQVVIICTPTFLHYEQIRCVLAAGKHCIVEKPLCLSSKHGHELMALAKQMNRQLCVGQVIRFWEEYEFATELVRDKRYGEVLDAHLYRLTACPQWSVDNWLFDRSKSGLIPFDLHIHDVDFMVSLFGRPVSVVAQRGGIDSTGKLADYYRVLYNYSSHTVCAEASWYQSPIPFTQGYRLYFERALLIFDGKSLMLYPKSGEAEQVTLGTGAKKLKTSVNVMPTNAYYREMEHFLDCIAHNVPSPKVPIEQIVTVLEIIEELVGEDYWKKQQ